MSPQGDQVVHVGVIGLGFMGATHVRAYLDAARDGIPCELRAVCDNKQSRRDGFLADVGGNIATADAARSFDPRRVKPYADADELLNDPEIDIVSICTPTDTHAELAIAALRAGKHLLVEKPVALHADDVRRVERAASESGTLCMPAMCMRFWPAWEWLKDRIDDRAYGACVALTLTRIGSPPEWARFYADANRCGGALVDLHIHDADFVRFCFGDPQSVCSAGTARGGAIHHVTTLYRFEDPALHVAAEGAWLAPGTPFRMRYIANFENVTADFDLAREPQLLLHRDGRSEPVGVSSLSGYDQEVRHLVSAVARGANDLRAKIADAVAVAELLDAERRGVETRAPVNLCTKDRE